MGKEMTMDVDLNSLPASEAQRLHNMLNESRFFDIPIVDPILDSPDEFEYTITVVAGNSIHTVRVSDTSMPPSLRPVVEELTELAKEGSHS